MRRDAFLKLPEGTIYAKGKPWCFGGLCIKFETTGTNDWWSLDPCWVESRDSEEADDRMDAMLENGASYPMQESIDRDGLQDQGDLFLVFERDDLLKLQGFIAGALELPAIERAGQ